MSAERRLGQTFARSAAVTGSSGKRLRHGPVVEPGGVRFRLWAPAHAEVSLLLESRGERLSMAAREEGWYEVFAAQSRPGDLYRFELSDGARIADPASRFQPQDVHGPSAVVDPLSFHWSSDWRGRAWTETVLYELHVGAFTPEGTFKAAARKIPYLASIGVTAIGIMPVSDFPGRWNWGYDGVFPFAPDSTYGTPDDFKAFIDAAHGAGVSVLLDVVYNHFGPEGSVLQRCAPDFFTDRHQTPWGPAINFDGPQSGRVRSFVIENAEYWLEEFRLDGLRLDAVQTIIDNSPVHILKELAQRVRDRFDRPVHLLLENEDNDPALLARRRGAPTFYTAQWNDDVHHVLHVAATGESEGYYGAYHGDEKRLGRALAEGFAYQGEVMPTRSAPRGKPSGFLPPVAFVAFLQNHDHIGNRALGERLNALVPLPALRALAAVYLLAPQIPMIFMGEEWRAKQPFLYFCDLHGDLADAVREGRRKEFARFAAFAGAAAAKIPDPLAESTYCASKLDWDAQDPEFLDYYRTLLALRRRHVEPLLSRIESGGEAETVAPQAVRVAWRAGERTLALDANLSEATVTFPPPRGEAFFSDGEADAAFGPWAVRWSVE